jgi:hypothetical protein
MYCIIMLLWLQLSLNDHICRIKHDSDMLLIITQLRQGWFMTLLFILHLPSDISWRMLRSWWRVLLLRGESEGLKRWSSRLDRLPCLGGWIKVSRHNGLGLSSNQHVFPISSFPGCRASADFGRPTHDASGLFQEIQFLRDNLHSTCFAYFELFWMSSFGWFRSASSRPVSGLFASMILTLFSPSRFRILLLPARRILQSFL